MSETTPLTAGGFALPPTPPDAPAPDDDWLLQDFLTARALAPSLGIAARLDAFAAAHGATDALSADDATQAATPPNGGVVVRYRGPLTDDERAATSPPEPPSPPPPAPPPAPGASPLSPPPDMPNTGAQTLSQPAAPAPAFPVFAPEPDFALDDWDAMPLGLKLQRFGEGLAPATPDTAHLSPLGRVLQAFGQGAADGQSRTGLSSSLEMHNRSGSGSFAGSSATGDFNLLGRPVPTGVDETSPSTSTAPKIIQAQELILPGIEPFLYARPPVLPRGRLPDGFTPYEDLPQGEAGGPNAGMNFPRSTPRPNGSCTYCNKEGPMQNDHIIPKSQGGNNSGANRTPACETCNPSKGGRTPQQWYQSKGWIGT
jgi:hypothetical protein